MDSMTETTDPRGKVDVGLRAPGVTIIYNAQLELLLGGDPW